MNFLAAFFILTLLTGTRLAAAATHEPPCLGNASSDVLPQAPELAELASRTAFLGRESAGPMDGLFLFKVTQNAHADRIHIESHRLSPAFDSPARLNRVRKLLEFIRKHKALPELGATALDIEQRLLLLSLLANESPLRLATIRNRMGFVESAAGNATIFRDRQTGLTYAQKGEAILEFNGLPEKRVRAILLNLARKEQLEGPLSVWNPRTKLWFASRIAGQAVPDAARVQLEVGTKDRTVFAGFEDTRAFHTEFPDGSAIDGIFGAREAVRAIAHEQELREKALSQGSVRYDLPPPTPDFGASIQNKPFSAHGAPEADWTGQEVSKEKVQAMIEEFAKPYTNELENDVNSRLQDTRAFMQDFMARTGSQASAAEKAPFDPDPSPEGLTAISANELAASAGAAPGPSPSPSKRETVQTLRMHGARMIYEHKYGDDTDRNFRTRGTVDILHRSTLLTTCMTDYFTAGSDVLKYCYEANQQQNTGAGHKIRFESSSTRGKDDIDLNVGVATELRTGQAPNPYTPEQTGRGASLGVDVSRKADIPGVVHSATIYSRYVVDVQPINRSQVGEIGARHCDRFQSCLELSLRHEDDSGSSDGLIPRQSVHSLNLTYSRPF